ASGMSRCRTLSGEGDVFRRRRRYFHEGHQGMRVLRYRDCPLHKQRRAGERRLYPRHGHAEITGTAGHAHAEPLTAAHGSQGTCQDPQAEDQDNDKAALTHAWSPASCSEVSVTHRKYSNSLTKTQRISLHIPILFNGGQSSPTHQWCLQASADRALRIAKYSDHFDAPKLLGHRGPPWSRRACAGRYAVTRGGKHRFSHPPRDGHWPGQQYAG